MVARPLYTALLAAALLAPGPARAQRCEPSRAELDRARSLFIAGSAAVDAGRWADAVDSFERSYALSCAPSALYNLAMALRALGRHREARDHFDRLMREHPNLGEDLRSSAEALRREEAARVAVLELVGIAPDLRPELHLDGRSVTDGGERPLRLETDAGAHSLVARIEGHQPFLWDGELRDGQTARVEVRFEPLAVAHEEGLDPLLIVLPAVAAGLIAGGITLGVVLQEDAQLRPHSSRTVTIEGSP